MAIEDSQLNHATALPESDASQSGGSNGALGGATAAAVKRGYLRISEQTEPDEFAPEPAPEGFLNRPHGWER